MVTSRRLLIVAAVFAAGAVAAGMASARSQTQWKLRDLGALPMLNMTPLSMNDRGDIAGLGSGGSGVAGRAFLWHNGKLKDLGSCGGYSRAVAINRRGNVAGSCGLRRDGKPDHAFLWLDGRAIDLGTLGWRSSDATAINDRGEVVGTRFRGNEERAFLWNDRKMRDLGTLGGRRTEATAINDNGDVAGDSMTGNGEQHAFLWRDGHMTDLGTLRGRVSSSFGGARNEQFVPQAINGHGTIVGLAHDPIGSYETAFIWRNGKLSGFPALDGQPSRAIAINDRGQVLVQTTPPTDKRGDAYLWQNGKLRKLPALSARRPATFPRALNAYGEVVGTSLLSIGHSRPFFWARGRMTPLPTPGRHTAPPFVSAYALNDNDQIAGSDGSHLLLWTR